MQGGVGRPFAMENRATKSAPRLQGAPAYGHL